MKDVIKTQQHVEEIKTINGKKVQVNRRKRRNNMKGYYALAVVFAGIIAAFLCLTVFFNVSRINVEGVTLYRYDQILNVGGVAKGENLIRTDTSIIEERLKKTLVYLDDVKVKKEYPSKIVINCTQAEKAADILCDDTYYVLSFSGKILEAKNGRPTGNIPIVKGFELKSKKPGDKLASEDSYKADILNTLLSNLRELDFEKITQIDLTSRSDIIMNYDNRIEIKLGSSVDIDYKLSYLKAVIDKSLAKNYEGTLVYNSAESGISAIPKEHEKDSSSKPDLDTSSKQDSSAAESQNTADAFAPDNTETQTETQTPQTQAEQNQNTYDNGNNEQTYNNNNGYNNDNHNYNNGQTNENAGGTDAQNYNGYGV